MNIIIHPDWAFIFTVLGIVLTIIGVIASINFNFGKEVMVYPFHENLEKDQFNNISKHKLTIVFQNIDKYAILKSDFLRQRFVEIEGIENLEHLRAESDCEFNTVVISVSEEKIIVENDFLDAKKLIKLTFLFWSKDDFMVRVRTKIIGGNSIDLNLTIQSIYEHQWETNYKTGEAYGFKLFVFVFIVNGICWQILKHSLHIEYNYILKEVVQWNADAFGIIFLGVICESVIVLISFQLIKFLFVPYSEKAKKVKNFYRKN